LINRSLSEKLKKLQEALDDRKLSFNALSAKNALLEADITVAKQQHNDAENQIKKFEIEKEQLVHRIRRECKQEKDVNFRIEDFY
jgi:chromosome segregation ATPase